ncbi:hypothetical protein RND81_03G216800 [Saponaria officinalis]|uniref:Non-specific serine/threonine protein kinase n=1 Tax=Saponaria officinalis TaxID=3572 RepID=A0AAW1M1Z4_SAPOF
MNKNSFNGDIPASYASLASLQEIDLSQNNLSGPIPAFFYKIPSIYYLNLSYNDFQGRVPTNSVFANASAIFLAGIPDFVVELQSCIYLDALRKKTWKGRKEQRHMPLS